MWESSASGAGAAKGIEMKFWTLLLVAAMAFASVDSAEAARRLGGGH